MDGKLDEKWSGEYLEGTISIINTTKSTKMAEKGGNPCQNFKYEFIK